ncbi:hypothetical protein [Luteibacter yeojuensis]|uniref:DUF4124 domain-containing protein n=1 Tax=Luteibacter yeojuensis TaxID=345309 RepID=A0A0F3KAW6_9GAMM|nr:hypothetical protein [Luteibacter yeojuensis]KJV28415.1 hypothetical protein VI08_16725 [Luteibacter yeojuensis]
MRAVRYIMAGAALLLATSAIAYQASSNQGYRYRWKDASGQSYFSDSLNTDALKAGYDIVNAQGMVVRHVDRQLTADERAAAKKLADQQAAAKAIADQRARDDAQMLNAYPTEQAFAAARQSQLDNYHQAVGTTQINLRGQEKTLADLLNRAGDLERAKQPVPPYLTDRINEQRATVSGLRTTLQRQQASEASAKATMEADIVRYRQLKARADANGG